MNSLLPGFAAVRDVHPLIVHFPIALWSTALLFWVSSLCGSEELWRVGRWILYLGVLSGLGAAASGLLAADRIGHDSPGHDLVHVHRNFMIAATALAAVTAALAWARRGRSGGWTRAGLLAGLVLTVSVCALGADRGALLVYGHGIGTRMAQHEHPPAGAGSLLEAEQHHQHGDHPD